MHVDNINDENADDEVFSTVINIAGKTLGAHDKTRAVIHTLTKYLRSAILPKALTAKLRTANTSGLYYISFEFAASPFESDTDGINTVVISGTCYFQADS